VFSKKLQGLIMKKTLAFDVYGTLIDTNGVTALLETMLVDQADGFDKNQRVERAQRFADTWRAKQLEYSFRRGLMKCYEDFTVCTKESLIFTCAYLKTSLTTQQQQQLLDIYKTLPAYNDVAHGLSILMKDHKLIAFSNGTYNSVKGLLVSAGLDKYFAQIVSADEIKTFKPNPDIYQYLLTQSDSTSEVTWLISSNSFDVIGAKAFGLQSAWVKRNDCDVFDPWGVKPDIVVQNLEQLASKLSQQ
jgi:2-haloacid dehalogenase